MGLRKLRPRYLILGGLVGLGCGIAISDLCGQGPLHDRAPPPHVLNYPCLPRRETWGYYAPKWRRWPGAPPIGVAEPEEVEVGLPGTQVPRAEEEDVQVPTPAAPRVPLETAPPSAEAPPAAVPGAVPPGGALEPAAPLPDGAAPGVNGFNGLNGRPTPAAPVPTTPLPGAPLPDEMAPTPGEAAPQPAPAPGPLNPFDGAEAETSPLGDDPPPALPASLKSVRRTRNLQRNAEHSGTRNGLSAGINRLPVITSPGKSDGRYAVQQTSATVWAAGTKDIRPADPNEGRVQQAIHHEPVD